jgi:hypothetical protein
MLMVNTQKKVMEGRKKHERKKGGFATMSDVIKCHHIHIKYNTKYAVCTQPTASPGVSRVPDPLTTRR